MASHPDDALAAIASAGGQAVMINQRYSADAPCTDCGRIDCTGCLSGYILDADGLGLEYVESTLEDRWYADLARHQYDSAMLDRRLRERRSES